MFQTTIDLENQTKKTAKRIVKVSLKDGDQIIKEYTKEIKLKKFSTQSISFSDTIPNVKAWSAEIPTLYEMEISFSE